MIAWYGEPKLKAAAMERLREHKRLDQFEQGIYFEGGRGCHLGCLTHRDVDAHEATEKMFGIEKRIAHWLEEVFEYRPPELAANWVIESTEAIPVGADMSFCYHQFVVWILSLALDIEQSSVGKTTILSALSLHQRAAEGKEVTSKQWERAYSVALLNTRQDNEDPVFLVVRAHWDLDSDSAEFITRSAWFLRSHGKYWNNGWERVIDKSLEIFRAAPVRQPTASEKCDKCVRESMARLTSDSLVWGDVKTGEVVK